MLSTIYKPNKKLLVKCNCIRLSDVNLVNKNEVFVKNEPDVSGFNWSEKEIWFVFTISRK